MKYAELTTKLDVDSMIWNALDAYNDDTPIEPEQAEDIWHMTEIFSEWIKGQALSDKDGIKVQGSELGPFARMIVAEGMADLAADIMSNY